MRFISLKVQVILKHLIQQWEKEMNKIVREDKSNFSWEKKYWLYLRVIVFPEC